MKALITGASGGLGAAFAEHYAGRGWDLVLCARNGAVMERLARELAARHEVRADVLRADLATSAGLDAVVGYCARHRVDALINNAGVAHTRPFDELSRESIEREILLDFHAHVVITHAVVSQMKLRGSGTVVLVASLAGLIPVDDDSGYVAAKSGIIGLAESLRHYLSGTGVRVTAWCPGFVRTNIYRAVGSEDPNLPSWMWSTPERTVSLGMRKTRRASSALVVPEWRDRLLLTVWRLLPRPVRARAARAVYAHSRSS